MNSRLAERLLAEVLGWSEDRLAEERPLLEHMSSYKYDEYQRFGPGKRFLENLPLWLRQFNSSDRETAYQFFKTKLIFVSYAEMLHLVKTAYPDVIRPILMEIAAKEAGLMPWQVAKIASSEQFKSLRRRTLFLGLSDGAHMDEFRRSTGLHNDQFVVTHEFNVVRAEKIIEELPLDHDGNRQKFECVFLIDDFVGSGTTYLRNEDKKWKGKLTNFADSLAEGGAAHDIVDHAKLKVFVLVYLLTDQGMQSLQENLKKYNSDIAWTVVNVARLSTSSRLDEVQDEQVFRICDEYYDPTCETGAMKKGGTHAKVGFADGRIPLVLSHNTPNNSPFILWADPDDYCVRGLFPRIERHKA